MNDSLCCGSTVSATHRADENAPFLRSRHPDHSSCVPEPDAPYRADCIIMRKQTRALLPAVRTQPRRAKSSLDVVARRSKTNTSTMSLIPAKQPRLTGARRTLAPCDTNGCGENRTMIKCYEIMKRRLTKTGHAKKKVTDIYDILREIDAEVDQIPLKRRRKKWIRTIYDLIH